MMTRKLHIPEALKQEHHEILDELQEATQERGKTGVLAKEVRGILMPHFEKEEETAMPIIGMLARAAFSKLSDEEIEEVLKLHKSLRNEYSQMLKEHKDITEALLRLRKIATSERKKKTAKFVDRLRHHAKMEEEVLYPAAIVLGDRLQIGKAAHIHAPHPSRPSKH